MFFHVFLSHLYFDCNCAKCPGSLVRNQHRVSGDQQDSVDSAWAGACNLDVQLCRHGLTTVFIEILNYMLCHYGMFG
jgi:hypothetical protein